MLVSEGIAAKIKPLDGSTLRSMYILTLNTYRMYIISTTSHYLMSKHLNLICGELT